MTGVVIDDIRAQVIRLEQAGRVPFAVLLDPDQRMWFMREAPQLVKLERGKLTVWGLPAYVSLDHEGPPVVVCR